jgi:hypothetical protein
VPSDFFDGVGPGELTAKGAIDQRRIGFARRKEYVKEKKLLSETYRPEEILSVATFKNRCLVSGEQYMAGLYPL